MLQGITELLIYVNGVFHHKHFYFITVRIRRMIEGNVFTGVCLLTGGGGLPHGLCSQVPSLVSGSRPFPGRGGIPWSCYWSCTKSCPRSSLGGTPVLSLVLFGGRGDTPVLSLVLPGGTPGQGYRPVRIGVLPSQDRGTPPQESEFLLRSGRYTSCGHAGGLSCFILNCGESVLFKELAHF